MASVSFPQVTRRPRVGHLDLVCVMFAQTNSRREETLLREASPVPHIILNDDVMNDVVSHKKPTAWPWPEGNLSVNSPNLLGLYQNGFAFFRCVCVRNVIVRHFQYKEVNYYFLIVS